VEAALPTVEELDLLRARLAGDEAAPDDATRVDLLASLEALKSACAATQARLSLAFEASQRAEQAARGIPANKQGRGIASQVALARRDSPFKGQRHLGLARALVREMPHTLRALAAGDISEWRATLMVRETATLSAEHRSKVDAELADRVGRLGDAGVAREARKLAYALDPAAALRRSRSARKDRHVSIRPAPDTMSYLTGFLPVEQGVAVHTALTKHADALRSTGDARSRGQIMADTLVERVTGQSKAPAVPVEIQLVMTDRTLLGQDDDPARLNGHGPIPAGLARSILRSAAEAARPAGAWVRRLYTSPGAAELVAMDARRRRFPAQLRRFLVVRDEVCRTPWCDATIRHADHAVRAVDGGETSADNGQGLCETCNLAKEAPGWSARSSRNRAGPGGSLDGRGRHTIEVMTPTGHAYSSNAPAPPGARPQVPASRRLIDGHLTGRSVSSMERRFAGLRTAPQHAGSTASTRPGAARARARAG